MKTDSILSKYHTPRAFQIIVTILFIAIPVLMVVLNVFHRYFTNGYSYDENLYEIFRLNYNNSVVRIIYICSIVASVFGIIVTWINRVRYSIASSGIFIIIMILSLIRNYNSTGGDYYYFGYYPLYIYPLDTYYLLWSIVALLLVFTILASVFTKKGPRSINRIMTLEQSTSAADELIKFKQLLDAGAITQEEYDCKKKELLKN